MSTHIDNSTRFGMPKGSYRWTSNFEASRDAKGKWTGSESLICNLTDIATLIPTIGANCDFMGFEFLTVSEVKVMNIEGDLAEINFIYSAYNEEEFIFDENNLNNYVYDLQITQSREPIKSFYKFHIDDPIPKDEWFTIGQFESGFFSPEPIPPTETYEYTFVITSEITQDTPRPPIIATITSAYGKKLVDYLIKGIDYEKAVQIWRVSHISANRPTAELLNDVGKLKTPKGAPAVSDGRDWRFTGLSVQENDHIFNITEEYQLSDIGGSDTFLYTDEA
jgi:hypothetical protein